LLQGVAKYGFLFRRFLGATPGGMDRGILLDGKCQRATAGSVYGVSYGGATGHFAATSPCMGRLFCGRFPGATPGGMGRGI
jgi:hypothetical protein